MYERLEHNPVSNLDQELRTARNPVQPHNKGGFTLKGTIAVSLSLMAIRM